MRLAIKSFVFLLGVLACHGAASARGGELNPALVKVVVRSSSPNRAFYILRGRGGPEVTLLGRRRQLVVPAELRRKPITAQKLIEGVAGYHGLKIIWLEKGKFVVLQRGGDVRDVARLGADLKSHKDEVRISAAGEAWSIEDQRAVRLLGEAANKDKNPEVVRWADWSLRRLGLPAATAICGEKMRPVLDRALTSRSSVVRSAGARSLGMLGDEKSYKRLLQAVADGKAGKHNVRRDPGFRYGMALGTALGRAGKAKSIPTLYWLPRTLISGGREGRVLGLGEVDSPRALSDLLREAESPDRTSATILARRPRPPLIRLLCSQLEAEGRRPRAAGAYALGYMERPDLAPKLHKLLKDKDKDVRLHAACSLVVLGDEKGYPVLEAVLADRSSRDRRDACMALGRAGGSRAIKTLQKVLSDKKLSDYHYMALGALGEIGGEEARKVLLDQIGSVPKFSSTTLDYAVEALARCGNKGVFNALVYYMRKGQGMGEELANIGTPEVEKVLCESALSKNKAVARSAHHGLGKLGGKEARKVLLVLAGRRKPFDPVLANPLGWAGGAKAAELLAKPLDSDKYRDYWLYCGWSLAKAGGPRARDALVKILSDKKYDICYEYMIDDMTRTFPDDPRIRSADEARYKRLHRRPRAPQPRPGPSRPWDPEPL